MHSSFKQFMTWHGRALAPPSSLPPGRSSGAQSMAGCRLHPLHVARVPVKFKAMESVQEILSGPDSLADLRLCMQAALCSNRQCMPATAPAHKQQACMVAPLSAPSKGSTALLEMISQPSRSLLLAYLPGAIIRP